MRLKGRRGWEFTIFTVVIAVVALNVSMGCASASPIYVPDNYSTIQEAVDHATPGETIIVRDEVYTENVIIDRRLTIRSENGSSNAVVDAHTGDNGFAVLVDWVNISGFTVTNASINGIDLNSVNHCNISHNILLANNHNGIWMNNASNNIIQNNTVSNTILYSGIGMRNCSYNNITGNSLLSNNQSGLWMENSNHNIITHNNASFSIMYQGIGMQNCDNNNITGNSLSSNNNNGIWITNSNNDTITHNRAYNNNHSGFGMQDCNYNTIENNNATANNFTGIFLNHSKYNDIIDNRANANANVGIMLVGESTNNQILNNTASFNFAGIAIVFSQHNNLTGNTASSNSDTGIKLNLSSYNNLTNCSVSTNGQFGIWLRRSPYNTLRGNSMEHNGLLNLAAAETLTLEEWDNDIDTSNTVNGAPIYRFFKINGTIIEGLYTKKLYVVGCNNVTIRNISYSDGDSLTICFTNNSIIENCTITNNKGMGFLIIRSHYNKLINNKAINNNVGFALQVATQIEIADNIIKGNTGYGVSLDTSTSDNRLYHNRFVANSNQASDNGTGNSWDNGYPSGGNYWSEYNGTDSYNGPDQDIPGRDGIGDTPFTISGAAGAQDRYPFLHPTAVFTTGPGIYPSISGTHNGTITPSRDLAVSKLYTYPCAGTGGHTTYIKIWNSTSGWNVTAMWHGYMGDWRNLTFEKPFILAAGTTYNYTIITGSYPQIIHARELNTTGGTITCTEFVGANGRKYESGIPAIRLDADPITIGIVVPLTGGMSTTGTDMWRAAVLAAEELNAMGGVNVNGVPRRVRLVQGDTESSTENGVKAVTRLITGDRVDLLVGGFSSGVTLADSVVAVDHHVPFIVTGASDPAVTRRTDIDTSYLFHHCPTTDDFPNSTLLFVEEIIKPAIYARFNFSAERPLRLAVLYQNSSYGQGVYDGINKTIAHYNLSMEVVAVEKFAVDETNYTGALTALKEAEPDVVYPAATSNEQSQIVTQGRRDVGLNTTYLSVEVNDEPSYYTGVGSWGDYSIQESRFSPYAIPPGPIHTAVVRFKEDYENQWGTAPGMAGASSYEGVYIAAEAIRNADTVDKAAVRAALAELEMPQLIELMKDGVITFSPEYRESKFELFMQQLLWDASVNETRPKIVWPAAIKETDFVLPEWYVPGSP
jgi:parallel beta-helix repeat protein